jgi:hypothetical protein
VSTPVFRAVTFAILLGLAAARPALADDLLRPGDTITGKLRFFKHQHPNGTWIPVYQITSDHPKKFAAKDEFCGDTPPVTFHLAVMDDKAKKRNLDRLLGKRISVVLDGFFCSETAWHVGDAIGFQWHFADPPKR